jgi:hypothetical protein
MNSLIIIFLYLLVAIATYIVLTFVDCFFYDKETKNEEEMFIGIFLSTFWPFLFICGAVFLVCLGICQCFVRLDVYIQSFSDRLKARVKGKTNYEV